MIRRKTESCAEAKGVDLAIDTSLMRSLAVDKALESVAALGYRYVEVGLAHYAADEASGEESEALKEGLARNGLKLAALFGTYPVSYPEEEIRTRGVQQFQAAIGRANQLGCGLVVAELMGDADRREDCSRAFRQSMTELVPFLERNRVTLCFEAHPGDFIERNKFAVDLIRSLQTSRIRYLYCIPHSFILGENVREMIEYARDAIAYVHLADSMRPERTFFSGRYFPQVQPHQHLTVGKGDIDMRSVFAALRRVGYSGFLTVDPFSMFDSPVDAARESKAAAEKLLSETDG